MTEEPPTDRTELAVRHTVGSIMSGRANVDQVIARLADQGFQEAEIEAILNEASRRMNAVGEMADRDFFQTAINTGIVLLLLAGGVVLLVGFPDHGRGVGIFYTAILVGLGALGYGLFGKMTKR